jgi:hypothetical protein
MIGPLADILVASGLYEVGWIATQLYWPGIQYASVVVKIGPKY